MTLTNEDRAKVKDIWNNSTGPQTHQRRGEYIALHFLAAGMERAAKIAEPHYIADLIRAAKDAP
jgi:hypothetical protein